MTNIAGCIAAVIIVIPAPLAYAASSPVDAANELADGIVETMRTSDPVQIAVFEFVGNDEMPAELGSLIAEELTTQLFLRQLIVVERRLLSVVVHEQGLSRSGLIDPGQAMELGRLVGADAIVSGSITALGDSYSVNARMIDSSTGALLAVAAAKFARTQSEDSSADGKSLADAHSFPSTPGTVREVDFEIDSAHCRAQLITLTSAYGQSLFRGDKRRATLRIDCKGGVDFSAIRYDYVSAKHPDTWVGRPRMEVIRFTEPGDFVWSGGTMISDTLNRIGRRIEQDLGNARITRSILNEGLSKGKIRRRIDVGGITSGPRF